MRGATRLRAIAELPDLLGRFARAEVVVVGDFMADEYIYGETERVSREAPVLIVRYERSELVAGGAGNAAHNLAALGVRVRAVGVVGKDPLGDGLVERLSAAGVDVAGLLRVPGRATEQKTRILAGGRSTRRQQMLRLDRAPAGPLPAATAARLAREVARAARGAGAVLASDYGTGTLGTGTIALLRELAAGGLPVCADSRYRLADFAGLTMVKPNEPELEAATGVALEAPGALDRAGRGLLRRLGVRQVLVTRGRNGMSLFRKGEPPLHLEAHGRAEALDVTGAGDTVGATYSAAIAAGASPDGAARLANVAGALVVRKAGTATVTREELLAELVRS